METTTEGPCAPNFSAISLARLLGHEPLVEEGRRVVRVHEPVLAPVGHGHVSVLQGHGPADGRAQRDGHALPVHVLEVERAVGDRLRAGGGRELDVAVHAAHLVLGQPGLVRIEVGLRGHLRAKAGGVEERNAPGGRLAGGDALPERVARHASRRHHADPRYDGSPQGCSVSTCPSSGRGASGPRWKTMKASSSPSLTRRCFMLIGMKSALRAGTSCGSPSSWAVTVPVTQ